MDPGVLTAGATVGLAVAVPFGPIGLMVVALGRRDWRSGAAAAVGVATADLNWAVAAVRGGAALATLPGLRVWQALAHAVLGAVGVLLIVRGLRRLRRRDATPDPTAPPSRLPWRWFAVMYGTTLPNPLTAAVFTAAAIGVGVGPDRRAQMLFAATVGLTSLVWQLMLAAAGRHVVSRVGRRGEAVLAIASGLLLLAWPVLT